MSPNLDSFVAPKSIAVVGVSKDEEKLGSVILQNILESGYKGTLYAINPKYNGQELFSVPCHKTTTQIKKPVDLAIIVIPSIFVSPAIDDLAKNKTKNVIIISAGFGETGNFLLEKEIAEKCKKHKINLLGPNCLGAIFPHQKINASFSNGHPEPGSVAFISQSGAFCTAMLDWANEKGIGFSHFISLGNKAGINEIDLLQYLAKDRKTKTIALYLESLHNGKELLKACCRISPKKNIIILEPGQSEKAQAASLSHTGSLAPDHRVVQSALKNVGAIQVQSAQEMFGVIEYLSFTPKKNHGPRVAILTNAGGIGVITTDLAASRHLNLPTLSKKTQNQLKKVLPHEATTANPVDLVGDAKADRYNQALSVLTQDPDIDQILVLLTPQRTTQIERTAQAIAHYNRTTDKCIIASFIGGTKVEPGRGILQAHHIPSFDYPAEAVKTIHLVAQQQAHPQCAISTPKIKRLSPITKIINQTPGHLISASHTKYITQQYKLDCPQSQSFTDKKEAQKFAQKIFPQKIVLKIAAQDAIHKTDLKGVIQNINTPLAFSLGWDSLESVIESHHLKNAQIQVQEYIEEGIPLILGINTDRHFGKIMLAGAGGIYTEILSDSAIRVLPSAHFESLLAETKIYTLLKGQRGQRPKAIDQVVKTMEALQRLALDYPEIDTIDLNPVIVTEKRAVCVDIKLIK